MVDVEHRKRLPCQTQQQDILLDPGLDRRAFVALALRVEELDRARAIAPGILHATQHLDAGAQRQRQLSFGIQVTPVEQRDTAVVRLAGIPFGYVPPLGEARPATEPRRSEQPPRGRLNVVRALPLDELPRRVNLFGPGHVTHMADERRDLDRRAWLRGRDLGLSRGGPAGHARDRHKHARDTGDASFRHGVPPIDAYRLPES